MTSHRHILSCVLTILAFWAVVLGGQTGKRAAPARQESLPTLSAQEIFKHVSPSVMVVESLDAEGKVTKFGSGVVIGPLKPWEKKWTVPPVPGKVYKVLGSLVVTNRHVIEDGVSFRVEHNGEKWPAKLIKVDPDHDLAELSVEGLNVPALQVRDSSELAVGEKVYSIGAPEGLELTISEGLISGLRDFDKGRVIQTSAAISPGSSGGGLFDAQGRLVGITTFYLKGGQSLNFALPAEWTIALNRQRANGSPRTVRNGEAIEALAWTRAGDKAVEASDYDAALRAYKEAIRLQADLAEAWDSLGAAYYDLREYDQALGAEDRAIRLNPDDGYAWVVLGLVYHYLGQDDKALSAERQATRLGPADEIGWESIGVLYLVLGEHRKAVTAEQEAVRLKPDEEKAWSTLGAAYEKLGECEMAITAYRETLRLRPDLERAWFNLGVCYDHLGQHDKQLSAEQEAVRLKPDDANAWAFLGYAYGDFGQYDKMLSAEQEVVRLKPEDANAWIDLAGAYVTQRKYDKAISAFQEAVQLKPGDANAWFGLGRAFQWSGQRAEVIKVYEKLKTLDPTLADKFFKEAVLP